MFNIETMVSLYNALVVLYFSKCVPKPKVLDRKLAPQLACCQSRNFLLSSPIACLTFV